MDIKCYIRLKYCYHSVAMHSLSFLLSINYSVTYRNCLLDGDDFSTMLKSKQVQAFCNLLVREKKINGMFFLLQWKICAQLATRIGVPAFCSWDRCKGTALRIIPGYPKPLQILPHLTRSILDSTAKSVLLPSLCKLKILFKLIGIPGLIKDNKAVVVQLVQARALRNRAAESEFCLSYLLYACSSIHQVIQNGLSGGFGNWTLVMETQA